GEWSLVAEVAEEVDPAPAGKHHVEEDQIRRRRLQGVERGVRGRGLDVLVLVPERHLHQLAQRLLVVAHEDRRPSAVSRLPHRRGHPASRKRRISRRGCSPVEVTVSEPRALSYSPVPPTTAIW